MLSILDERFWKGKKVFLTGHTGFKGGWLSLWLGHMGAEVTGYALEPNTSPSIFEVADVSKGMHSIIGDIRDADKLSDSMIKARPDIVFHMAAQPLVRESYKKPFETYEINVLGTVNLLEAVRKCSSVRATINITTDKCYENKEWCWGYRENEPLGGYDPYSSSKACSELVTAAYRNSFFDPQEFERHRMALATARAGNVIGGGDWALDRIIPDILRAFEKGVPVKIRSPRAIRPWQYVLEPLCGYLLLAEKLYKSGPEYAESWNFGPNGGDAMEVIWIVEKMKSAWGQNASYEIDAGDHPHEAGYLKLDISKAKQRLGWEPRWNLERALSELVDWHKAYLNGKDMRDECIAQIGRFSKNPTMTTQG